LSKRPADTEGRKQVGHWQRDIVSSANHKQALVTFTERQSEYAVIATVSKKTAYLVSQAIIKAVTRFEAKVKTLTYDNGNGNGNGNDFCEHELIN
jgi:IS30 family transposase